MTNRRNTPREVNSSPFVFFGTPTLSVIVLEKLANAGYVPALIVTVPDKPSGRGKKLTPPTTKTWALAHNIPVFQPPTLKDDRALEELKHRAPQEGFEFFVVAAYGKLIPQEIVDLPKHGTLNVHPSLLPNYRGPSPIQAQILNDDRNVGVTIIQIDAEMDHGPIVAQSEVALPAAQWPLPASELGPLLFEEGGEILSTILPSWVAGDVKAKPQEHDKATYCSLVKKEDAEIDLADNPHHNLLKIRAYDVWPRAHFFVGGADKKVRVVVTDAEVNNDTLHIKRVIPEGKREMDFDAFVRGLGDDTLEV